MAFIAPKPEGACPRDECNKCHASRVARVITSLYPEAMATVVTEFVNQEVVSSLHSCRFCSARHELSAVFESRSSRSRCLALAVGEHCMGVVSALCSLWVWFKRKLMSVLPSFSNLQRLARAAFKTHWFESFYCRSISRWKGSTPVDLSIDHSSRSKTRFSEELAGLGAPFLRCCDDTSTILNE